jgi:hypothetical protein
MDRFTNALQSNGNHSSETHQGKAGFPRFKSPGSASGRKWNPKDISTVTKDRHFLNMIYPLHRQKNAAISAISVDRLSTMAANVSLKATVSFQQGKSIFSGSLRPHSVS